MQGLGKEALRVTVGGGAIEPTKPFQPSLLLSWCIADLLQWCQDVWSCYGGNFYWATTANRARMFTGEEFTLNKGLLYDRERGADRGSRLLKPQLWMGSDRRNCSGWAVTGVGRGKPTHMLEIDCDMQKSSRGGPRVKLRTMPQPQLPACSTIKLLYRVNTENQNSRKK